MCILFHHLFPTCSPATACSSAPTQLALSLRRSLYRTRKWVSSATHSTSNWERHSAFHISLRSALLSRCMNGYFWITCCNLYIKILAYIIRRFVEDARRLVRPYWYTGPVAVYALFSYEYSELFKLHNCLLFVLWVLYENGGSALFDWIIR